MCRLTDDANSMLKLHMHAMLLSTAFNRTETVLGNLYHGLTDLAARTLHYMGSMKIDRQPGWRLVISKYRTEHSHPLRDVYEAYVWGA